MHFGGNGMTCLIRPHSLSIFNRRPFLPICSSWVLNMSLMADQCALGFCVFSSVDSLWISMISSFKTHSRGRPGFLVCFIELKLSELRFKRTLVTQDTRFKRARFGILFSSSSYEPSDSLHQSLQKFLSTFCFWWWSSQCGCPCFVPQFGQVHFPSGWISLFLFVFQLAPFLVQNSSTCPTCALCLGDCCCYL